MATFNHIVSVILNPLVMGLALALAAAAGAFRALRRPTARCRRWTFGLAVATVVWFWLWSTPLTAWLLARPFDAAYPPVPAESAPAADAIVVLGGGITCATNGVFPYPDLYPAADRLWHAARLHRAGKAPRVLATGKTPTLDSRPFLLDLGLPPDAVTALDGPRNTEEESRLVASFLPPGSTILLVTSAAHMRRSELLFRHAGLRVIPAPTDHETAIRCADGPAPNWLCPDPAILPVTSGLFKEHYAGWAYRHIRRFRPADPPVPPPPTEPAP